MKTLCHPCQDIVFCRVPQKLSQVPLPNHSFLFPKRNSCPDFDRSSLLFFIVLSLICTSLVWQFGGAWQAAVHGVAKRWTRPSNFTLTFHFHALEKEMVTLSNVLAWGIPGMGEPGGLPSMGSHRVRHDRSDLAASAAAVWQCIMSVKPLQIYKKR